jgi:C_GCAxxG_C_C family probable redox protein
VFNHLTFFIGENMDYLQMKRAKIAQQNFHAGYNCAQSVFLAFLDVVDMDKDTAMKMVSGMGAGVSRLREVSGAVSAMTLVVGILYGYSNSQAYEDKNALYSRVQTLAYTFKEETGSYVCKDLLKLDGPSLPISEKRTEEYYLNRPCEKYVGIAAGILETYIDENPYKK